VLALPPGTTELTFTGGDRGWKGDVPVVRLSTDKIRALGWSNRRSTREALRSSLASMLADTVAGRFEVR
jgi:UDP-glucose 4-epimerase